MGWKPQQIELAAETIFNVAKSIALALDLPFAVAIGVPASKETPLFISARSFGKPDHVPNQAFMGLATIKVLELWQAKTNLDLLATPTGRHWNYATDLQGGVSLHRFAVGVSGMSQEVDKLLACLFQYMVHRQTVTLHHVGYAAQTVDEWEDFIRRYRSHGIVRSDKPDHARLYAPLLRLEEFPLAEMQWWADPSERTGGKHLDFAVASPKNTVLTLATWMDEVLPNDKTSVEIDGWDDPSGMGPVASIKVDGTRHSGLTIMFRPTMNSIPQGDILFPVE